MKKILPIINAICLIAVLVVNFLANFLPINNQTTGEISDNIENLFVPAGITFAIWGVIYIFLILFVVYQFVLVYGKRNDEKDYIQKINIFFIITCIGNFVWIFMWHYNQIVLSLLFMLVILVSLIMLYLRLEIGKESNIQWKDRILIKFPISIYLGWISVATVANVTAVLVTNGWGGFGISKSVWTIIILFVILLLSLLMLILRKDFMYSFVIVWALVGIIIKRFSPQFDPQTGIVVSAIIVSAVIVSAIVFIFAVFILIREIMKSIRKEA